MSAPAGHRSQPRSEFGVIAAVDGPGDLSGEYFPIGLVLMVLVLVLNEGASAGKWYEETAHSPS